MSDTLFADLVLRYTLKGDLPGHEFRGNQYTEGVGGGSDGSEATGGDSGGSSQLVHNGRYEKETTAIDQSPYLTIKQEGIFTGYHWSSEDLTSKNLKGAPWDKNLGFTKTSNSDLVKNGAVFSFVDDSLSHGGDWYSPSSPITKQYPKLYKITGQGYLVHHSQEGDQIIFRADKSKVERVMYSPKDFRTANEIKVSN